MECVLIVSSDPALGDRLAAFAESAQMACERLGTGPAALERMQFGVQPRLALIDLSIPGVRAPAVLKALRRKYPDLVTVSVGAALTPGDVSRLLEAGASTAVSIAELDVQIPQILESLRTRAAAASPVRQVARVPVRMPVMVRSEGAKPGMHATRDLSLSGVFVLMNEPLQAKARVKVRLEHPTGPLVELEGEVTRRVEAGANSGVGIQFTDTNDAERARLGELFSLVAGERPEHSSVAPLAPVAAPPPLPPPPAVAPVAAPPPLPPPPSLDIEPPLAPMAPMAPDAGAFTLPDDAFELPPDDLQPPAEVLDGTGLGLPAAPAGVDAPATLDLPPAELGSPPAPGGSAPIRLRISDDIAIGERLLNIGNFSLAQARFAKALESDPGNRRIAFLHALAGAREAMRAQEIDVAVEWYVQLLDLDPECEEAKKALREIEEGRQKKGLFQKIFGKR